VQKAVNGLAKSGSEIEAGNLSGVAAAVRLVEEAAADQVYQICYRVGLRSSVCVGGSEAGCLECMKLGALRGAASRHGAAWVRFGSAGSRKLYE
jgi:hypothetical protein